MYRNRKYRKNNAGLLLKANTTIEKSTSEAPKSILEAIDENIANRPNTEVQNMFEGEDENFPSSQISVPPSQPPTQRRYLSQRSTMIRTQSKTLYRPPNSYFELVLMKSGVDLDQPDSFVLSTDHMTFVTRLNNYIKTHKDYPNNVKTFIDGFRDTLNDSATTLKLLTGCTINVSGMDNIIQSQDSVVMNFLTVDFLQEELVNILMAKALEFAKSNDDDSSLLPLILSQLKFVTISHGALLYEKLIEIFENATESAKNNIIFNVEHVIDPVNHDDFVQYLINNTSSNEELFTKGNIETFTNLSLNVKTQSLLRRRILDFMSQGCSILLLPLFVKFLLKISTEDAETNFDLVTNLRRLLKWDLEKDALSDIKKSQTEVFACIKQALIRSKKLFDVWQKVVVGNVATNAKAIDFIFLILLLSIREDKCNYLEAIMKRHIKLGHINAALLASVKKKFFCILEHHADIILHMLHDFLKEKDLMVLNFTKHGYRIVFGIENCDRKRILIKLVEISCDKSSSDLTTLALEILKELNKKYTSEMQNHGLQLLPMLDRINDYDLKQFRMVMELLCSISYPLPPLAECPILQDHIDMLVKKQVISGTSVIQKQGIIGIVQLVDHIVRTEKETEGNIYDLDMTMESVNDMPDGRGKLAANYINKIFAATTYCAESLALFYDEMACVMSPKNKNRDSSVGIDRYFLIWFCDLVTNHFQSNFVVEKAPTGLKVELSYQNCINTPEEQSDEDLVPIAIDIGGSVLTSSADATASVTILPSLFNLTRVLHFTRYERSLESINAVLGCAIVLPTFIGSINDQDIFDEYDDSTAKKIINMHFHTANWYRETIGAFASQDDPMIRKKILLRMAELIKLEESINNLMAKVPADYMPPPSHFMDMNPNGSSSLFKKPAGRPKKPAKTKSNKTKNANADPGAESEGMSMLGTMRTQNVTLGNVTRINQGKNKSSPRKNQYELSYGPRETYRQLDPDIMLVLREQLDLTYPLPEEKVGDYMGLLEFRFIMTDLINKLESVTGIKKFATEQASQYITFPIDLINDLIQFVPKIVIIFKQIAERVKQALDSVDGALGNMDLFTDELNFLKVCFGLCLHLFAALLTWTGFEDEVNEKLLKESLRGINEISLFVTTPAKSLEELSCMGFEKFTSMERVVIDLKSAVHLYDLVMGLKKFANNKISDKSIADLCKKFLIRKWFGYDGRMEKGSNSNILIDKILRGFMRNAELKTIRDLLKVVLEETKFLRKNDDCLRMFPNIYKANFPMLYRNLCEAMYNALTRDIEKGSNNIKTWERSCEVLNILLQIVKSLDIPRNFSLFLKYGHLFLKFFLNHGMPVFESNLRRNPEQVNELLKSLQPSTTFLHNLSCHSKAIKNTAIVTQIPFVRETIENIVFRVKAALAANNCSSVFWMRVFKNKDLQGDEIESQTSSLTASNENDDEEDLPEDDRSIDETVLDLGNNRNEKNSRASKSTSNEESSRSKCF